MKKWSFILIFVFLLHLLVAGTHVKNTDRPEKGTWDFNLRKEWDIETLGEDVLVDVRSIQVDEKGTLYVPESKLKKIFVLNPYGKQLYAFGKAGEGPGEFKFLSAFYLVGQYLVVPELGKIHFFSRKGNLIKDINPGRMIFPRLFIDENRIIKLSGLGFEEKKGPTYIELFNLETQKTQQLVKMESEEKNLEYAKGDTHIVLRVPNTTPSLVFASDKKSMFYGNNDFYQINKVDLSGKALLSFSVKSREKNNISQSAKMNLFKSSIRGFSNLPKDAVNEMVKQIPDESPYFQRIIIGKNGLIYVLLIDIGNPGQQAIDIFSPEGKYLYRSKIDLSDDFETIITIGFSFERSELYIFAENHDGDRQLSKYNIHLPQ